MKPWQRVVGICGIISATCLSLTKLERQKSSKAPMQGRTVRTIELLHGFFRLSWIVPVQPDVPKSPLLWRRTVIDGASVVQLRGAKIRLEKWRQKRSRSQAERYFARDRSIEVIDVIPATYFDPQDPQCIALGTLVIDGELHRCQQYRTGRPHFVEYTDRRMATVDLSGVRKALAAGVVRNSFEMGPRLPYWPKADEHKDWRNRTTTWIALGVTDNVITYVVKKKSALGGMNQFVQDHPFVRAANPALLDSGTSFQESACWIALGRPNPAP